VQPEPLRNEPTDVERAGVQPTATQPESVRNEPTNVEKTGAQPTATQQESPRTEPTDVEKTGAQPTATQQESLRNEPTEVEKTGAQPTATQQESLRNEPTDVEKTGAQPTATQQESLRNEPTGVEKPGVQPTATQPESLRNEPTDVEKPGVQPATAQPESLRTEPTGVEKPGVQPTATQQESLRNEPTDVEKPGVPPATAQPESLRTEPTGVEKLGVPPTATQSEPQPKTPAGARPEPTETAQPPSLASPGTAAEPQASSAPQALSRPASPATAAASTRNSLETKMRDDNQVEQTACSTCGGFHSSVDGPAFHESLGCANGGCVPGRQPCYLPNHHSDSVIGEFFTNLYQCLCCPDPCYQPAWVPAAYASLFADYARPRTVTRIRYDNLEAMTRPDRNQFWMNMVSPPKAGKAFQPRARLQQVYLYQEAAGEKGSFFVEIPYRQLNPNWQPTKAGFGDINFGIKSLLFDCEMLQVAFQFRTYTPSGDFGNNLGTGNFSLDPSIMASLKLAPDTYFQAQVGNWVPLSGKKTLAGGVLYWLMSLNQVLWYCTPDSPLIATLEMDGWSFEDGGYTILPGGKAQIRPDGGGVSYFNIGPGLRQSICNRMDIGGAITFATDTAHWAQPWFRFEVRFLF
jgi:hypothetical protein